MSEKKDTSSQLIYAIDVGIFRMQDPRHLNQQMCQDCHAETYFFCSGCPEHPILCQQCFTFKHVDQFGPLRHHRLQASWQDAARIQLICSAHQEERSAHCCQQQICPSCVSQDHAGHPHRNASELRADLHQRIVEGMVTRRKLTEALDESFRHLTSSIPSSSIPLLTSSRTQFNAEPLLSPIHSHPAFLAFQQASHNLSSHDTLLEQLKTTLDVENDILFISQFCTLLNI